ncbi:putative tyrosinase [Plectosphaerella cucumerina]|jgi:tyrosinase|uniref:tyrosinase n=1 Tax=Plectosphaerella cucumerina TaxID=40658 RepID=A0A8K0THS9_9PEZI|nr:putative tyrosinase [Plectosphaerella cucumerina]
MPVLVRRSLQEIVARYDDGDKTELENLIRAFRIIQKLPATNPDSWFVIAGYHGEPFVAEDPNKDPDWWGGYCQHQTVLFPTWHRAYLHRLEQALRNAVPSATDLALPFWDECISYGTDENPLPWIVTARTLPIPVDNQTDNPFYSYTLQKALADNHTTSDTNRYSKPAGYQTVRYPLSGLVGNDKDREATELHNSKWKNHEDAVKKLNLNVKEWLDGTVKIDTEDDGGARVPDTFSVYSRYRICLEAPNYTVFSNKASMAQYIVEHGGQEHYGVALEEPHNAIHLALGGFYQKGVYNADPIRGANGDMGENETAGFDPVFYLHHAFVDYAFWQWQLRHNVTAAGSLTVEAGKDGTFSGGDPVFPKGTPLDMRSPLEPFKQPNGQVYTSEDVTDIENQLGYTYGTGSLDQELHTGPVLGGPRTAPIERVISVSDINRADYSGSFVIRTAIEMPDGKLVEIGREAVLSRWSVAGCRNCQGHLNEQSFIAIDQKTMTKIKGDRRSNKDVENSVRIYIQSREFPGEGDDSDRADLPAVPGPGYRAPRRQPVVKLL